MPRVSVRGHRESTVTVRCFLIVTSINFTENTYDKHLKACFYTSVLVLMYIFEILLINEIHTVDADEAVCCVPTGQFLFVFLFGQIPHLTS